MATLIKFTFLLRGVKVVPYHRRSFNLINKLCAPSFSTVGNSSLFTLKSGTYQNGLFNTHLGHHQIHKTCECYVENKESIPGADNEEAMKKLTLFQRFKAMYRDYWYVLVPVHILTSAIWFGGFYYAAKSGIDIVAFVEKLHLSDSFVQKIKTSGHSTAGYLAISYALYKIFTPLRYTVTLGGTTVSINYLKKWGYIKPLPKKEELKKIITEKRDSLRERRMAFRDKMMGKLNQKKTTNRKF